VGFIPANYAEPVKPSEVEEEIARLMRATRRRVAQYVVVGRLRSRTLHRRLALRARSG